ncbi:carbohydrate binding family 9 domain-containing protein [Flavihumibacter rivuli]|uniref:carbohydrate binding family 9 domain-containing protein n=1 Tax=Flavihumibacter rivuli TaxID=2838156 RepID=UPI001BDF4755|nr:carbohydrate binding family 9 domain-containing protein [Flavihumibacter rivuli]ULQ57693.1 carbohydrate binding family 9 domain-containing protein [Flavihumibacter rivuli]
MAQNLLPTLVVDIFQSLPDKYKRLNGAILCLLLFSCISPLQAQQRDGESFQKEYRLPIRKSTVPIQVDGLFDEPVWQYAAKTGPFWRKYPNDEGRPVRNTEVRVTFDDKFLYVAFTAYDSGKAFVTSLKRDVGHDGNDGVAIVLDPLNQRASGFFFVVNAFNAQSEDQLTFTSDGPNFSWDNKWYSATKRYPDRWTAEIAIPFKTLRYQPERNTWGINFVRIDTKTNEYSVWTHVPVNFRSYDLGYTGALVWEDPAPSAGSNISFIPYITGTGLSDKENNVSPEADFNAGFDAKIGLSSSMNLDLTVNPDFSQVEVDRQVTNLTRFNIFFPERRTFFLENADLYSDYGTPGIRPFYSRRIGLDKNGNKIPILGGARLTGSLTKRMRVGVMNMQTGRKGDYAPENYTAVSVSQQVLKRSSIRGYFLNRQSFMTDAEKKADPLNEYGRNAGVELGYSNLKGNWNIWGTYHHSFKPGINSDNQFFNSALVYRGRNLSAIVDFGNLGTNYYADMGFIERIENYDASRDTLVRLGYKYNFTELEYKMFPKGSSLVQHGISLSNYYVLNPDNSFNENNTDINYNMQFANTSSIFASVEFNQVQLQFPISFTGAEPLPKGFYQYRNVYAEYSTDFRKALSVSLGAGTGGFYNGTNTQVSATMNFRHLPHLNVSLKAEYYKLTFPEPYGSENLLLLAPRVDINFTTSLFWTTFIQYNTQRNNININSRFQWRFKPMSDMFLVYTDNYFSDPLFKNRNRSIVFKLNYWLNL